MLREQHEAGGTQLDTMKFRASLTQRGDEIKGTIELSHDPAFNLEVTLMIIERVSKSHNIPVEEVIKDLWRLHKQGSEQNE